MDHLLKEKHSPPAHPRQRLTELPSGSRGIVHQIESAEASVHRLMAMGLCVGREVHVVRQGNPLILGLLGARIGVSGRLAQHVVVEMKEKHP